MPACISSTARISCCACRSAWTPTRPPELPRAAAARPCAPPGAGPRPRTCPRAARGRLPPRRGAHRRRGGAHRGRRRPLRDAARRSPGGCARRAAGSAARGGALWWTGGRRRDRGALVRAARGDGGRGARLGQRGGGVGYRHPAAGGGGGAARWRLRLSWGLEPRVQTLLGDPEHAALAGRRSAPARGSGLGHGFAVAGSVAQALAGNLAGAGPSDSRLPHVRSDVGRYAQEGRTSIPTLYAERIWTPAPDVFARVTAGIWSRCSPASRRRCCGARTAKPFALGARPRIRWCSATMTAASASLGYSVATGHVSLYADLPWYGTSTACCAAGGTSRATGAARSRSAGASTAASRSAASPPSPTCPSPRFGEGSFDKGIFLRFPLRLLGPDDARRARPRLCGVQRDGGQRLLVDNPLWEVTRDGRADALQRGTWASCGETPRTTRSLRP